MKKNNFIYIIILFIFSNFLIPTSFSCANSTNGININLDVNGCNKNGICEVGKEDFISCPEDCSTKGGEGGSTGGSITVDQNNLFQNLAVVPGYTSATIKWDSFVPTIFILKWGESNDYQSGTLQNVNFVNNHSVVLSNLKSNTIYYFTIETETYLGKTVVISNKTFTTTTPPDTEPPMNPTGATALSATSGITISWINPKDKDFSYIRVVRSTERYQSDPYGGRLIYEGSGQYLRDGDVKEGIHYYYTIFARDKNGNFSSGTMEDITYYLLDSTKGQAVPETPTEPEIKIPTTTSELPNSYRVEQNDEHVFMVVVDFGLEKQDYDMWVEIKDKDNKVEGRYFLSDRKDDYNYKEVKIPNTGLSGEYDVLIYRHFKGEIEMVYKGTLNIIPSSADKERGQNIWFTPAVATLVIIILSGVSFWFARKMFVRRKNGKEGELIEASLKEIEHKE